VQITQDSLFQLDCHGDRAGSRRSRVLALDAGKFSAIDLSPRQHNNMNPSICYAKDAKAIVVIGGSQASKKVEFYDLQSDRWCPLPELNQGREDASSCYHGGYLYVFGGKSGDQYLNTIERINIKCLSVQALGSAASWTLIQPDSE